MALQINELASTSTVAAKKRYQVDAGRARVHTIATIAAAPILERLTPMARHDGTGNYAPWDTAVTANGLDVIQSFLLTGDLDTSSNDEVVQTSASEEVLATMMEGGLIHLEDVPLFGTNTLTQIRTAVIASGLINRFRIHGE